MAYAKRSGTLTGFQIKDFRGDAVERLARGRAAGLDRLIHLMGRQSSK